MAEKIRQAAEDAAKESRTPEKPKGVDLFKMAKVISDKAEKDQKLIGDFGGTMGKYLQQQEEEHRKRMEKFGEDLERHTKPPDYLAEDWLEFRRTPEGVELSRLSPRPPSKKREPHTDARHAVREFFAYCWDTPHLYYIAAAFLAGGGVALALSSWSMAELLFAIGIALFFAKGIHANWNKENRGAIAVVFVLVGLIAIACEVGFIEWKRPRPSLSPPPVSLSPDWKESVEARKLASQLLDEVQGLIDEGRVIDVTDYEAAATSYAKWAEKCSVVLGKVDNRMRQFGVDTEYKSRLDRSTRSRRILPLQGTDFDRSVLKSDISQGLNELDRIKKTIEIDTRPDRDLIRSPLQGIQK